MKKKKILLIITGSIAAYKTLSLIRMLKNQEVKLNCVITKSAEKFITPLAISSLSGTKTYNNLFSLDDELDMGHIKLAKENDLVVIAPASADFISKIAHGVADDLASTIMLVCNSPVMLFPAMNSNMLNNFFTKKNFKSLDEAGYKVYNTDSGELACGDLGYGRMKEPEKIFKIIQNFFLKKKKIFKGFHALVTAGPTQEFIDPVRYLSNYSSGKQGYAIAEQLSFLGAEVSLVSGPTNLKKPDNINKFISVKTADEMFKACKNNIPKDLFVSVAAVSDWKVKNSCKTKIKKSNSNFSFELSENRDILKYISKHNKRPKLVVGFAAETDNLKENSILKIKKKHCDIIVANNVSSKTTNMGGDKNSIHIYNNTGNIGKYLNMDKKIISYKLLTEVIMPLLQKKIKPKNIIL